MSRNKEVFIPVSMKTRCNYSGFFSPVNNKWAVFLNDTNVLVTANIGRNSGLTVMGGWYFSFYG